MEIALILAKRIVIMFIFIAVGYVLYKTKVVSDDGRTSFAGLLVKVVVPVVIFNSFLVERTAERTRELLLSFGITLGAMVLAAIVAALIFRKDPVENFSSAFSNVGYMSVPLVYAVLGADAVFYIASFVVLVNVFQWTYGIYIFTKDKSIFSPKKLLLNPIIIAFILGVSVYFIALPMPELVTTTLTMFSNLNGPMAMLVTGCFLASAGLKQVFCSGKNYFVSVVRLLLIPILTIGAFFFIPETYHVLKLAVLLAAAAPVGANVTVCAGLYDQDTQKAVTAVCLSTLLCVVTMPLILLLANFLWAL